MERLVELLGGVGVHVWWGMAKTIESKPQTIYYQH